MAGASTPAMAIAVSRGGGLGSLACALLSVDQARADLAEIRAAAAGPVNVNFFCHTPPAFDAAREEAWRARGWRPTTPSWASTRDPSAKRAAGRRSMRPSVPSSKPPDRRW